MGGLLARQPDLMVEALEGPVNRASGPTDKMQAGTTGICEVCQNYNVVHGLVVVQAPEYFRKRIGHIVLVCPPRPHDPEDCMRKLVMEIWPGVVFDMLPTGSWTLPGAHNPKAW